MKTKLLLISLIFTSIFSVNAQERLLKVSSKDSIGGEPRITAWLGVNMKLNGYYNIKGGLQNYDTFNVGKIDVYGNDNRQSLGVDLYQTQIRMDATYNHPEIGQIRAHTSWDFWGGNGHMRLRKAYVMTEHWQVGQDWENFGDQNIWPNVLDFDGPPSGIWARVPFVKYFNSFADNKWHYEIALQASMVNHGEFPNVISPIEHTYQNLPDGVLAIKRKGDWGHVRLSTVYRGINYLENSEQKKIFGYGASLSGMFGGFGERNFQFQLATGKGISAYIVSFGGSNYDAYPHQDKGFETTPSIGGWGSYEHYFTKTIHLNLVYGFTKFELNDIADFAIKDATNKEIAILDGNASNFHHYFLTNIMWDPYPNFSIGVEFDYGIKSVKYSGNAVGDSGLTVPLDEDQSRDASRVSFGFLYNF